MAPEALPSDLASKPKGNSATEVSKLFSDIKKYIQREKSLTEAEKECCHMSHAEWWAQGIEEWRKEFRSIPRCEHCIYCPMFK
jgi:hypothetical protein